MKFFYYLFIFLSLISCSCDPGGSFIFGWGAEARFKRFVEKSFKNQVHRHPESLSYLGYNKKQDLWNDFSQSHLTQEKEHTEKVLKKLLEFDKTQFSKTSQMNWEIYKQKLETQLLDFKFRFHKYRENQLFGRHASITSFLINFHKISSLKSAKNYIARVRAVKKDFSDLTTHLQQALEKGITPPRFVFDRVSANIQKILKGFPLDESEEDHVLLKNFKQNIAPLNLNSKKQQELIEELNVALAGDFKTAYENLLKYWQKLKTHSKSLDGVWQHPEGRDFYLFSLKKMTTTNMTPEEIHQLGLKHVQRLQKEILNLQSRLKIKGSLQDIFQYFRKSKKFYYTQPHLYIEDTKKVIQEVQKVLPQYFSTLPKHDLEILPVPSFMEKTTAAAFYMSPSIIDDSRPGSYFINFHRLSEQPKYELRSLTFHEALPGHHFQISIAAEMKNMPLFRRVGGFTVFTEGWALYAERLAQDMGLYKTAEDEYGRLAYELMRACRLVVDTGIHYKKWSREKAIGYLVANSAGSYESNVRSIERYIVNPGQATAYMIGFLKILELKKKAKDQLGDQFDIKEFHHQILKNGALPLNLLEKSVLEWLNSA